MYTVTEGQSSVEVCVNLTRPNEDIGDEVVYVEVYDNSSSIHIPAGVTLASKSLLNQYVFHFIYFKLLSSS